MRFFDPLQGRTCSKIHCSKVISLNVWMYPDTRSKIEYYKLTLLEVNKNSIPRGRNTTPMIKKIGTTEPVVIIGFHALMRCCLNAVSNFTRPDWNVKREIFSHLPLGKVVNHSNSILDRKQYKDCNAYISTSYR